MRVCVWKLVRACILYTYVAAALVHLRGGVSSGMAAFIDLVPALDAADMVLVPTFDLTDQMRRWQPRHLHPRL